MFLLGLTGDIASGKSTVARLLAERGAFHLDADALVHELYADRDFASQLQAHLQNRSHRVLDIVDEQGGIARQKLGQFVFADATLLRALEEFVHPAVAQLRETKLAAFRALSQPPQVVVLEAVKLVESGQIAGCSALWWITAAPETQMQRLIHERGLTEKAAHERLENQPSRTEKIALLRKFDVPWRFLSNDAALDALRSEVDLAWRALSIEATHCNATKKS